MYTFLTLAAVLFAIRAFWVQSDQLKLQREQIGKLEDEAQHRSAEGRRAHAESVWLSDWVVAGTHATVRVTNGGDWPIRGVRVVAIDSNDIILDLAGRDRSQSIPFDLSKFDGPTWIPAGRYEDYGADLPKAPESLETALMGATIATDDHGKETYVPTRESLRVRFGDMPGQWWSRDWDGHLWRPAGQGAVSTVKLRTDEIRFADDFAVDLNPSS